MMMSFNHFGLLGEALHDLAREAVIETADDVQTNVRAQIVDNGQIDTGYMFDSVYKVTADGSDYQGAALALPEIDPPEDDVTAFVAVAAEYGGYQNYGTRYLPPRPFFEPGVENSVDQFEERLQEIVVALEAL